MKRLFFSLCAVGLSCAAFGAGPEVNIVPKPLSVTPGAGTFTVTASTVIGVGKNAELRRSARIFAGEVAPVVGGVMKTAAEGDVRLAVDGSLEAEAYTLAVTPSGVEVRGGTPQGVFHGLQSLRQLVIDGEGVGARRDGAATNPISPTAGAMLDRLPSFHGRWTRSRSIIDILAIHKLNKFHWHLTDDQGWRIEIKKYPELTRSGIGARGDAHRPPCTPRASMTRRLTAAITRRSRSARSCATPPTAISTVIPEIELPGARAGAALTAYPWLGCQRRGLRGAGQRWGISKEVFCAGQGLDLRILCRTCFAEVIELFPSKYIHIGGDECPKARWKECPLCQRADEGPNGLKNEEELAELFRCSRIEKWLNEPRPQHHRLGRDLAGRNLENGHRDVVARFEGRNRRSQGGQPRSSWRPTPTATWTTTSDARPRRSLSRWDIGEATCPDAARSMRSIPTNN